LSVILIGAGMVSCGSNDSSSTSSAAARAKARLKRLIDSDTKAEIAVRSGVAAMELYAVDHNGSYAGATAATLGNIEPQLPPDLAVQVQQPVGYSVTVPSKASDTAFTATKAATGSLTFICSQPRVGTCPANGDWGS
jgi:hypothetical protein